MVLLTCTNHNKLFNTFEAFTLLTLWKTKEDDFRTPRLSAVKVTAQRGTFSTPHFNFSKAPSLFCFVFLSKSKDWFVFGPAASSTGIPGSKQQSVPTVPAGSRAVFGGDWGHSIVCSSSGKGCCTCYSSCCTGCHSSVVVVLVCTRNRCCCCCREWSKVSGSSGFEVGSVWAWDVSLRRLRTISG